MLDECVLMNVAVDITACHMASLTNILRKEVPLESSAQRRCVDALRNVDALGHFVDVAKRPLDAVENAAHDARAQLDGKRLSSTEDGISHGDAGCRQNIRQETGNKSKSKYVHVSS